MGKRHLGMKMDSLQYIKPAVAYIQELIALASEKGFIMSRVNAREISNRLSDMINNDIINSILKVKRTGRLETVFYTQRSRVNSRINLQSYRAYKWAIKRPECASQILCTVNERNEEDKGQSRLRSGLLKVSSFPAAWAASNKLGINFWNLYGAIMEHDNCTVSKTSG